MDEERGSECDVVPMVFCVCVCVCVSFFFARMTVRRLVAGWASLGCETSLRRNNMQ